MPALFWIKISYRRHRTPSCREVEVVSMNGRDDLRAEIESRAAENAVAEVWLECWIVLQQSLHGLCVVSMQLGCV